jgi:hypothetical protein
MEYPRNVKELRAFVQRVMRTSAADKSGLGALAEQDTITVSQISDYVAPVVNNSGQSVQSGDGTTTSFTISHGYSGVPVMWLVTPASTDAKGEQYTTADGTNITVHYTTAPASGTNNLTFNWMAVAPAVAP